MGVRKGNLKGDLEYGFEIRFDLFLWPGFTQEATDTGYFPGTSFIFFLA